MKFLLLVALGGAIGSVGRYGIGFWIHQKLGYAFPVGTLFVNIVGSFLIGLLYVLLEEKQIFMHAKEWKAVLMVGLLGAFTTFSTFSLDTIHLIEAGHILRAAANVLLNLTCCFLFTALAIYAGRLI